MPAMNTHVKSIDALRVSAQKSFDSLPVSTGKYGLDIHSDISAINFDAIHATAKAEVPFSYYEERPEGIILADLSTAMQKFPEKVLPALGSLLVRTDKFESFHLANLSQGLVVWVPAHTQASTPITLPSLASPFVHILVLAESHSSVSLVQSFTHALPSVLFQSSAIEIFAQDSARVHMCVLQDLPENVTRFSFNRAQVSAHAHVVWSYGEFGSRFMKGDVTSHLVGEEASAQNLGIFVHNQSQRVDWQDAAHHVAPHTHSKLLARAMLDDESKLVYRALLKMTKEAKAAVGNQRVDSLVLSPKAESDPVPALEIEGSDVRCTHAATVGRLDKEKLFYLTSRGLDESVARALYIQGFLEHVLGHFPSEAPVAFFRTHASRKLGFALTKDEFTPFISEVLA